MITCYIGLGGNIANALGTPRQHIANAIAAFYASPHFANVTASSLYQSKAFGVTDQPDFFNAVVKVDTDLAPLALLDFCQSLESAAKRTRLPTGVSVVWMSMYYCMVMTPSTMRV